MKTSYLNLTKQAVFGFLLVGSVGFLSAQTNVKADPTAKANTVQQPAQQTNPTIEALKKQVETNPKDNEAWVKLATAYQDAQDWSNALQTWQKIETVIPNWAPVFYSEGYVYQNMKDNAGAKTAYEKYIAAVKPEELEANKKNLAYAHFFVAYSMYETNKEEAKTHIAKSLEYDATNEEAQKLNKVLNP